MVTFLNQACLNYYGNIQWATFKSSDQSLDDGFTHLSSPPLHSFILLLEEYLRIFWKPLLSNVGY